MKNILLRFIKLILIVMSITKKKYKLIKMEANAYYLELMFILLNIFQPQKLMRKNMLKEILFLRRKDKNHQKKNSMVNLLELIQVKGMMKIMKLAEYKHLLVNLKRKN